MRVDGMQRPLGVGDRLPRFSYKLACGRRGAKQKGRRVTVSKKGVVVWDSGYEETWAMNVLCGAELEPSSVYVWWVEVTDETGDITAERSVFETGLMGDDASVWSGAQWIGSPDDTVNTDGLTDYSIYAELMLERGGKFGIAFAARNKDDCMLLYIDKENNELKIVECRDNDRTDGVPSMREKIKVPVYVCEDIIRVKLTVKDRDVSVMINGGSVIENARIIPKEGWFELRKSCMLSFGFDLRGSRAVFRHIEARGDGRIFQSDKFEDDRGALSVLGTVTGSGLVIDDSFELMNAVPAVNVAKCFCINDNVDSARIYASAMGFYEIYINGEKTGNGSYAPGFTDYRKRMYYQTYDVTDALKQGDNIFAATVAKGYYSGYLGYNTHPMIYGKKNTFLAKLVIKYRDGREDIIVTDDSWSFTDKGPVKNADYLQGEDYDARVTPDHECVKGDPFRHCGIVPWPDSVTATNGGQLENERFIIESQRGPDAVTERVLTAVSQYEMPKGHFVYDMGQNMVGTVRVRFCGRRGTLVKLRYGEMRRKDGSIYTANLRSAACTDTYTLRGGEEEVFIPSFTEHGFRYVEITGNGYELTADMARDMIISVEGLVITNTPELTGHFECSNELVNRLQSCIEWGQRGNSLLVFTDCPQRNERMGWTGDAQVFAKTAAYNMYIKSFMDKWLTDVRDAQLMYNRAGAVPDTAPLGGDNRADGGCAGWGDAAVIVPWEMYQAYGDISVLEENYDMMRKWLENRSLPARQNRGMRTVGGSEVPERSDLASEPFLQIQPPRGDHLAYDETTPFILSATAYAAKAAEIMYRTAELLEKEDDAELYRQRHENIVRAFREAWVNDDGSISYWGEMSKDHRDADGNIINLTRYGDGGRGASQTAYALAIDFGLIPEEKLPRAAECFEKAIDENDGKLSVGFLGISHLLPALEKAGLTERAFSILEQEEDPGWLYSVKNGATTIWERWNSYIAETDTFGDISMNSFNHYAYGAVGEWMFGTILGINPGTPGYSRIILKPTPGGSLKYAKGSFDSPAGMIRSEWELSNGVFHYSCCVPANAEAVLYLPADNEIEGEVRHENGRAVIKLESGEHEFYTELGS